MTPTRIIHGPRTSFDPASQHDGIGKPSPARGAVRASSAQQSDELLRGLQRPAPMSAARGAFDVSGRAPNLLDVLVPAGTAPRTALRSPPAPYPRRPVSMPPYPHDPSPNAYPVRPRAYSMPGPVRERLSMPDPADYKPGGRFGTGQSGDPRPMQAYPDRSVSPGRISSHAGTSSTLLGVAGLCSTASTAGRFCTGTGCRADARGVSRRSANQRRHAALPHREGRGASFCVRMDQRGRHQRHHQRAPVETTGSQGALRAGLGASGPADW